MASTTVSTGNSTLKTYNSKKCVFLYKDHTYDKFVCIHKPFILTRTSNALIGQFITTNWFKVECDVSHRLTFAIVWVDENQSFESIEHFVNCGDTHKLWKYDEFTFEEEQLTGAYRELVTEQENNRSTSITKDTSYSSYKMVGINARLYFTDSRKPHKQNTLLVSLPTFEYMVNRF